MCEQLPDGDARLPVLGELGPVGRHPFLVVEPSAGMGDSQRHRGQPFRGRVDDDHRVPLPQLTCFLVPDAAPEVDDPHATAIGAARTAQLIAANEVLDECLAHGFEAWADVAINDDAIGGSGQHVVGRTSNRRASQPGVGDDMGASNPDRDGVRRRTNPHSCEKFCSPGNLAFAVIEFRHAPPGRRRQDSCVGGSSSAASRGECSGG